MKTGLNNPVEAPRKVWGKRRFERLQGNNLWQADFKMTEKDEWMISSSEFTEFCSGSGIEHTMASVRRPSTIGKIEVFHKV